MKDFLQLLMKAMDWKKVLFSAWVSAVKPSLEKLVASTENKFDDFALMSVSYLVEKFLGDDAKAEALKVELKK